MRLKRKPSDGDLVHPSQPAPSASMYGHFGGPGPGRPWCPAGGDVGGGTAIGLQILVAQQPRPRAAGSWRPGGPGGSLSGRLPSARRLSAPTTRPWPPSAATWTACSKPSKRRLV